MSVRVAHSGDLGDLIAFLPVLRQLGGGSIVCTQSNNPRSFRGGFDLLRRLVLAQPYVDEFLWEDKPQGCTHDITQFRKPFYKPDRTLSHSQANAIGITELEMEPWLWAQKSSHSTGRVVVARSSRYRNPNFPWRETLARYGDRMIFVGLPAEYQDFLSTIRRHRPQLKMEFYRIHDFMDLAELIAGADLTICNQSSPGWVAMGLGTPIVQETSPGNNKDSMVERANAIYCTTNSYAYP